MTETSEMTEIKQECNRIYGWVRDLPDHAENFLMEAHPTVAKRFPSKKFLPDLSTVYDQGQLGSCTANALAAAFEYEQKAQNIEDFMPSRLFIYFNERVIENTVQYDSGAALSDGIKALTNVGTCHETIWPYDINKFTERPSKESFTDGSHHQIVASKRVPVTVQGFKTMINMGYPVAFGFTVYASFESQEVANTGIMKMPARGEKVLGGHAVLCVGYDDDMSHSGLKGFLRCRNSWSSSWGQQGYFFMPYDYVHKGLVSDMWVISKNEEAIVKAAAAMTTPVEEPVEKPERPTQGRKNTFLQKFKSCLLI
jgi:C1A family cysteine protease